MGCVARSRVRGVVAVRAYGAGDRGARGVRPGDGRAGSRDRGRGRSRGRSRARGRTSGRSIDWRLGACVSTRACVRVCVVVFV